GLEIVIGALAMVFQRRLVPGGTELAATADVGHGDGATVGEPGLPCIERLVTVIPVPRRERQLKAAVAIKNGRHRPFRMLRPDEEVRHLRAVVRGCPVLVDGYCTRIERARLRLDERRRALAAVRVEGR